MSPVEKNDIVSLPKSISGGAPPPPAEGGGTPHPSAISASVDISSWLRACFWHIEN